MKCFGYTLITCEMGSEGYSSWAEYGVYEGDDRVGVIKDYLKRVNAHMLTDEEIISKIVTDTERPNEFSYHDYFTSYFIALPATDSYGHVKPIKMEFPVLLHQDSRDYDREKGGSQIKDYFDNYSNKKKEDNEDGKKQKEISGQEDTYEKL